MNKLIIVDDDVIIRRGLSKNIDWEGNGFILSGTAGNGEEALMLAERQKPDIIITDIRMPHIDGIEEVQNRRFVPLQQLHILGTEIALLLYRELWEWIHTPQMEQRFGGFTHFCTNLQTMTTSKEISATIRDFTLELIVEICSRRDSQQKQLLNKVFQYIESNYVQEVLSLQDVADHVNVSTGYLSAVLKKVGNTSFSDYLLKTRMNKALNLMSREDFKSYEIACKIGFSNPKYFSVCFKKYTGLSPSEYRSAKKQEKDV
ncbi:helix-turn-helix domain-containing protein [Paenibacillus sp. LMG 31456]|uniref:Helix-turn-helix domain-containing protein n=1 Tax=Paenibacillus foliorum TaxID=2654974 RepID=A0A972K1X8_9BACL|nr:helix-turn-helix domain-containing protein [Paenibacillus foliorum]NOU93262.1 helix-turn-helix domain-containing protein [Paenibacillus foliorum]